MRKKLILAVIIAALLILIPSGLARADGAQRIVQSITIDGRPAQGVSVVQDGVIQTFNCGAPQPYVTADNSDSGWACYEEATGMWLLHAQPTSIGYNAPSTSYVPSYSYVYPYPIYPYSYYGYPYFWGPGVGIGLGFNFGHGFHNHGFAHGGFPHGGPGFGHGFHGGFGGHMGGGHMGGGHMGGGHMGGGHR
jgi:uncharacterized membrane protein YgcG